MLKGTFQSFTYAINIGNLPDRLFSQVMIQVSKGIQYMTVSIISFSLMHLCVKFLPHIPVLQIILTRSIFSLLACLPEFTRLNISPWGNNKRLLFLRGLTGLLGLTFFFYSIQNIPLATAITISNLIPFFALLLAQLLLQEQVKWFHWLLLILSLGGVVFVKGFDHRVSGLDASIAVAGAFFAGSAHFLVRKLRISDHPVVIVFYFPLISIPIILPFVLLQWVQPNLAEWGLLLLTGIFTHVGQIFLTKAYREEEVSKLSPVYFLGIVLALFYGFFFFGETYTFPALLGMLLIILSVFLNLVLSIKRSIE